MKDLGKWQLISFFSRGLAMMLGLIQTFVILRILSVSEWGLIQLAVSIGGALGIYQHLGLASASTREISSAKDNKEIFRVFLASAFIRYVITFPISFGLFFFADYIATNWYKSAGLILPLKIYALTLLVQGFQSILSSVIAGTKRFKNLFVFQVLIALISVLFYVPLVYIYRVNGYFFAFILFNFVNTLSLFYISFTPLKGFLSLPTIKDLSRTFKDIFKVSIGIYIVKIIYTNWEKLGGNVLGLYNSPEVVGIYAFALLYAKKLMSISDAVTDVNLPVLSELFVSDFKKFKEVFRKNFDKVFFFIILSALVASYWSPEIVSLLVGSNKYTASMPFILPVIAAFIFYSIINIVKSSILIPAKLMRGMVFAFVVLIISTATFYIFAMKPLGSVAAMSWGMAVGSGAALLYIAFLVKNILKFDFFTHDHVLLILQMLIICLSGTQLILWLKSLLFVFYTVLFFWAAHAANIFSYKEVYALVNKGSKFVLGGKSVKTKKG